MNQIFMEMEAELPSRQNGPAGPKAQICMKLTSLIMPPPSTGPGENPKGMQVLCPQCIPFTNRDEEEHRRLDLQHAMIQKYFGALYPAREAVERLLEPRDQDTPMILDIGTGSGAWYEHKAID
ncbi:hypothetical protein FRC03_010063 [Tulasnella sp. 419]|nr:hypothetical protein FRC03_010063 [Tulasnella sp. 419]